MRKPVPDGTFAVCLQTGGGGMVPIVSGFACQQIAHDHLSSILDTWKPTTKRNFQPVVAIKRNGKYRTVEEYDHDSRLGPEDVAAIRAEEERFARGAAA